MGVVDRLKRIAAIYAICAIGIAGTAVGQAGASPPPTPSFGASAGHLAAGPAAEALHVVSANPDENGSEAVERGEQAAATGGREGKGEELREEEDED
jgi:hypothetical protein